MPEIKSKVELEAELEEAREAQKKKFCPIIKDVCRNNCICFQKGGVKEVTQLSKKRWNLYIPYCDHALINCFITVDH